MPTKEHGRCFPTLKNIKSFLRNVKSKDGLNALVMIFTEHKFFETHPHLKENAIDVFARSKHRMMDFSFKSESSTFRGEPAPKKFKVDRDLANGEEPIQSQANGRGSKVFIDLSIEEFISEGLPDIDEATVSKVADHLRDMGMLCVEDCQYVEEAFLPEILNHSQMKRLLAFFEEKYPPAVQNPVKAVSYFNGKNNVSQSSAPCISSAYSLKSSSDSSRTSTSISLKSSGDSSRSSTSTTLIFSDDLSRSSTSNVIKSGNGSRRSSTSTLLESDSDSNRLSTSIVLKSSNDSSRFSTSTSHKSSNDASRSSTSTSLKSSNDASRSSASTALIFSDDSSRSSTSTVLKSSNGSSRSSTPTSLSFARRPEQNWADDFQIPWNKFSKEVLSLCEENRRLPKLVYCQMIRILVECIVCIHPNPGRSNLRIISKKAIEKYPATFRDPFGDPCSSFLTKLEQCVENRGRRKGLSEIFNVKQNANIRKTSKNSFACLNWQPSGLPVRETRQSQNQHKEWLLLEHKKALRDEEKVKDLMIKTYASQRYTINSKEPIKIIKKEWPLLFEESHFFNHAKILLGNESISETICKNLIVNGRLVYDFMLSQEECKAFKVSIIRCLEQIKFVKRESKSPDAEYLGSILLILAYFGEEAEELIQINEDPVSSDYLEASVDKLTPFIATSGGSIFTAEEFYILFDGTVVVTTKDFKSAVAVLILSFFVFNIDYPRQAAQTLEFIQRIFAEINPERGSKIRGKRTSISNHVLNLVNLLRDFESLFES